MSGKLTVVGLGPGASDLVTPAVQRALAEATDLVGYGPYLDRIPAAAGHQCRARRLQVRLGDVPGQVAMRSPLPPRGAASS